MTLLQLLNNRVSISKAFTKDFTNEVKKCLEDYSCKKDYGRDDSIYDRHIAKKRYTFTVPYIFATHESLLSSMFEKNLELVISGKGSLDDDKAQKLKSIYKYLTDKLGLDEFLHKSAWWFLLTGMVSSYQRYEMKISGQEPMMDADGNPMMDENGEPVTVPIYEYHDPVVELDNLEKIYFSPDSEFSYDCEKVVYQIREKLMDVDEIESIYGEVVEGSEELEINMKEKTDAVKSDLKRAKCYYYSGTLPKSVAMELMEREIEWKYGAEYYAVFVDKKLLYIAEQKKMCAMGKWYGSPNEFFGYGLGRTLRSVQKEMSIRRGQQVRYADLHAFPWLAIDGQTTIDQNAIQDVQKRKPLVYASKKPEYIVPPEMPQTIIQADNIARSDAQFISGTLDLSKGAQQTNTVKTATGQQLFAQSQEKRVQKAREILAKYFREVLINLFILCRDNWDEEKVISITDEDGSKTELTVSGADLKDINFDTDIDVSLESLSVNKDTIAERTIALYDKVKDDPLVDRKKIFQKMLREGFFIKNPESYTLQEAETGSQPTTDGASNNFLPGGEEFQPDQLLGNEMAPNPQANPYE